jgi:hypothetical protein
MGRWLPCGAAEEEIDRNLTYGPLTADMLYAVKSDPTRFAGGVKPHPACDHLLSPKYWGREGKPTAMLCSFTLERRGFSSVSCFLIPVSCSQNL